MPCPAGFGVASSAPRSNNRCCTWRQQWFELGRRGAAPRQLHPHHSQRGVQLIDRAHRLDAHVVLADAPARQTASSLPCRRSACKSSPCQLGHLARPSRPLKRPHLDIVSDPINPHNAMLSRRCPAFAIQSLHSVQLRQRSVAIYPRLGENDRLNPRGHPAMKRFAAVLVLCRVVCFGAWAPISAQADRKPAAAQLANRRLRLSVELTAEATDEEAAEESADEEQEKPADASSDKAECNGEATKEEESAEKDKPAAEKKAEEKAEKKDQEPTPKPKTKPPTRKTAKPSQAGPKKRKTHKVDTKRLKIDLPLDGTFVASQDDRSAVPPRGLDRLRNRRSGQARRQGPQGRNAVQIRRQEAQRSRSPTWSSTSGSTSWRS